MVKNQAINFNLQQCKLQPCVQIIGIQVGSNPIHVNKIANKKVESWVQSRLSTHPPPPPPPPEEP
jgi:hypothetical protein